MQRAGEGLGPSNRDREIAEAGEAHRRFLESIRPKVEEAETLRREAAEKREAARKLFLELVVVCRARGEEMKAQEFEGCARACAPLAKGRPRHVDDDDY